MEKSATLPLQVTHKVKNSLPLKMEMCFDQHESFNGVRIQTCAPKPKKVSTTRENSFDSDS